MNTPTRTTGDAPRALGSRDPRRRPDARRAWLLVPAGVCLLAGLNAALQLAGVPAPVGSVRLTTVHGPLMVLGFLGTLISLERAVALRATWGYAGPVLLGAGGLALVAPAPRSLGQWLLVSGCAATLLVYATLWRRQEDDPTAAQIVAMTFALCAALLWTRVDVAALIPWLAGFIVVTIAAERVELARLTLPPRSGTTLLGAATALLAAATAALLWPAVGARAYGLVLVVLVLWLVRHDVARRTIHATGLPRYAAVALLCGYYWLAVAGAVWLIDGAPTTVSGYDVVVHATFLGFAISMVMAHAGVIMPAIVRRPIPYTPAMWIPLSLMHLGLVLRVVAGDLVGWHGAWVVGSVLTVVALLALPVTVGFAMLNAGRVSPAAARREVLR